MYRWNMYIKTRNAIRFFAVRVSKYLQSINEKRRQSMRFRLAALLHIQCKYNHQKRYCKPIPTYGAAMPCAETPTPS